ncbi:MAG TPA: hypothetical protein VNA13_02110 [Xanthomonadales bacterium]|nr:hypothetical protein [Xanthomonadales bacterium]
MIDPVQIVLLLVIIVLTILLVVLGVQVYFILKELRNTVKKANKVLDNANSITENIEEPLSAISSVVLGLKSGTFFTIAKAINSLLGKDREEKKDRD